MASKDLTLNIFAKDRNAAETFTRLAAEVEALNGALKRAQGSSDRQSDSLSTLEKRANDAHSKGISPLVTAILAVGPALIPIGAAAVAGLGGLIATGGAAVLVFFGIRREMAAGTIVGQSYTTGMNSLKREFHDLSTIAATNFLPGFNAGLVAMQPLWPVLARDTATFSAQLGTIASNVAPALVAMLVKMQPLFETLGAMLVNGSAKFRDWATSSTGFSTFVAYAQNQLPGVLQTLGSLLETIGRLAAAFAPFGSTSLMAMRLLSQVINLIPIGVLQTLVSVIGSLVLGFKAMRAAEGAAASLALLSGKMKLAGGFAGDFSRVVGWAARDMSMLGPVALIASVGIGIMAAVLGKHQEAAAKATAEVNGYTSALEASKGALDGGVRAQAALNVVNRGGVDAANTLGVSITQVTDAVMGDKAAKQSLSDQMVSLLGRIQAEDSAAGASTETHTKQKDAMNKLMEIIDGTSGNLTKAEKHQRDLAAATAASVDATQQWSAATAAQAAALGMTIPEYLAAAAGAKKQAASMTAAKDAMIAAKDAAGLLKTAYDELNGASLSETDAELAFNQSLLALQPPMKGQKADWSHLTAAGIANNQAVSASIKLAQQHGTALAVKEKGLKNVDAATADGTLKTLADLVALREHTIKVGGDTKAIDDMITKVKQTPPGRHTSFTNTAPAAHQQVLHYHGVINGVPRDIYSTIRTNANDAINAMFAVQQAIRGIPLNVYTTVWTSYRAGERMAAGGLVKAAGGPIHAAGGTYIAGRGSGIADNIPAMLSVGEFVSTAAATKRNIGALLAMNAGVAPSRYNGSGSSTAPTVVNLTMPVLYGNADAAARDILGALQRLKGQGVKINLGAAR